MASGAGFELTGADVGAARDHAVAAAETLGVGALVSERIADNVAGNGPAARWVRQCLGILVAAHGLETAASCGLVDEWFSVKGYADSHDLTELPSAWFWIALG